MLKRKIMSELAAWYESKDKKALVIRGLRQIGKTYVAKAFAAQYYKNIVYINFKNNSSMKEIFDGDFVVDRITLDISAKMTDAVFEPKETIIIFDEIQECQNARASLKAFVEDGRYDVIATGSLLGIKGYNKKRSKGVPIGYEEMLYMYPLDFEEFLWAKGINEDIIKEVKRCFDNKIKISEAMHQKFKELLLQYIIVGGMPEAVNKFINTNNINDVNKIKFNILNSYRDDMVKYVDTIDKTKIKECFNSIPYQLAKDNKKFKYSVVKKKATRKDYIGTLQWLEDFGIIKRCFNLSKLEKPLGAYAEEDKFKVYMADVGLLLSMFDEDVASEILSGNLNIYKGAIYENLFADFLIKKSKSLYYYTKQSSLEIDFVMNYENEITLVEVKSRNGNAKSLKTILSDKKKYGIDKAIKLGDYNIGYVNNVLTLPLYIGFLLR